MSKENQISKWDKTHFYIFTLKSIIGLGVGAIGGFLYYYFVGCASGTCPITSNPYISIVWGSVMGYLLGGMFERKQHKPQDNP